MPDITSLNGSVRVEKGNSGFLLESNHDPAQPVEAVCHHSDQYLSAAEINPKRPYFWQTLHEFPGFFDLDQKTKNAAHSPKHQHLEINWLRIIAMVGILLALLILLVLSNQLLEADAPVTLSAAGRAFLFGAIILLLLSAGVFIFHDHVYHLVIPVAKPKSDRFPVFIERTEIKAVEEIQVNLTNDAKAFPEVISSNGRVQVNVYPTAENRTHYKIYKEIYGSEIPHRLFAGIIAVINHNYVSFIRPLTSGHRIALDWTSSSWPENDKEKLPTLSKSYTIHPQLLSHSIGSKPLTPTRSPVNGTPSAPTRFFINCTPKLHALNSRLLLLGFSFPNHPDLKSYVIEELTLTVPEKLRPVTRIDRGLYDSSKQEVVWRNITLHTNTLSKDESDNEHLAVYFQHPILRYFPRFKVQYKLRLPGFLVSQLDFQRDHIWNTLGRKAQHPINIGKHTIVQGNLLIESKHLSQSHEISKHHNLITLPPLTQQMIHQITEILMDASVRIIHIDQASAPISLEPSNRLSDHAQYWDIFGQRDYPKLADKLDVHLIITGQGGNQLNHHTENGSSPSNPTPTTVDIRVSGRQEPRNHVISHYAQNLTEELYHTIIGKLQPQQDHTQQRYRYKLKEIPVAVDKRIQVTISQIREERWLIELRNIGGAHLYQLQATLQCPPAIEEITCPSANAGYTAENDNISNLVIGFPSLGDNDVEEVPLEVRFRTNLESQHTYDYVELRKTISNAFNEEDVKNLYFDLNIRHNPNDNYDGLIRNLLGIGRQQQRMEELLGLCRKERPMANWPSEPYNLVTLTVALQYKLDEAGEHIQERVNLDLVLIDQPAEEPAPAA